MASTNVRVLGVGVVAAGLIGTAGPATAAPRRGDVVIMPSATERPVEARGPRVVWLDFQGGSLTASVSIDNALTDTSFILSRGHAPGAVVNVAPFDEGALSDAQGMNRAQIIAYVKATMESIHAPYDISFVLARPASGNYQRLIFGGTCAGISGGTTCAGIAVLDCADSNLRNIGFAHPPGLTVEQLVTTAAQEMAHAYGLNHTEDLTDIMSPALQIGFDPRTYGSGAIPNTETGCGGAVAQDSHALLLVNIGPFGQDVTAPEVTIDDPVANGLDADGDVTILVTASDDEELAEVACSVDGTSVGSLAVGPFSFNASGLAVGSHTAECVATDSAGNTATDSVTFFVGDCVTSADCTGELVCTENLCVTPPPPGADGDLGDQCLADGDCDSGQCTTIGAFSRCSQDCAGDSDCPGNLECRAGDGVCWPPDSGGGNNGDGDDDGGGPLGCLSSVGGAGHTGGLLLLLGLALLGLRRRR